MKKLVWTILSILLLLSACQSKTILVTILADGQVYSLKTTQRATAGILVAAGVSLGPNDRLLYLGTSILLDNALPDAKSCTLTVRRAVELTLIESANSARAFQTSASTVGEALTEAGVNLYAGDFLDPPSETPITGPMTVTYRPGREIAISVDEDQVRIRSAAVTVGQALAEAGIPLIGLDTSQPGESSPLPPDGQIHVVRVIESVTLTEKDIPFDTRTELSADLEIDQQALLQGGEPGLAIARLRTRSEDGVQVSQQNESESIVRPPQDRIMGIGTKIVIRTATVDGVTFQYYRALHLYTTSYSPCRSATPDGRCSYGTSSGLPVEKGTVAMVYSWYLAFGGDMLYIPGYGFATVGDVGGSFPPGYHYWVDLAWTDADYQPMQGWTTVYFLAPVPQNLVYVLP
jgi:resuscitation-promoting factor RpfB